MYRQTNLSDDRAQHLLDDRLSATDAFRCMHFPMVTAVEAGESAGQHGGDIVAKANI